MENYNRHNDLISNFFFLIKKKYTRDKQDFSEDNIIEEFASVQDLTPYNYLDYMDDTDLKGTLSVEEFEEKKFPEELVELKKIVSILKLRIYHNELLVNRDMLLISRFFIFNWRLIIKEQIAKGLKNGEDLTFFKNLIISVLKEIEYRIELPYTLYMEHVIVYHYIYATNNLIDLWSNSIKEDIDWLKTITVEDVENRKLILDKNASKTDFTRFLIMFLKRHRFSKRKDNFEYKKEYKKEIVHFVNTIFSCNNSDDIAQKFNLSFLPKGRGNINIINFSKVFYYAQYNGIIQSKKGEINRVLSDSFNISERYFQNITKSSIQKELEDKSKTEDFIEIVLKPFNKRSK